MTGEGEPSRVVSFLRAFFITSTLHALFAVLVHAPPVRSGVIGSRPSKSGHGRQGHIACHAPLHTDFVCDSPYATNRGVREWLHRPVGPWLGRVTAAVQSRLLLPPEREGALGGLRAVVAACAHLALSPARRQAPSGR